MDRLVITIDSEDEETDTASEGDEGTETTDTASEGGEDWETVPMYCFELCAMKYNLFKKKKIKEKNMNEH